eukprot:4267347-Alexandrium_andersonii.AAC.1
MCRPVEEIAGSSLLFGAPSGADAIGRFLPEDAGCLGEARTDWLAHVVAKIVERKGSVARAHKDRL